MKITDGKKTVDIYMGVRDGDNYSPNWSLDFFDAGGLPYDEENDVYTVDDVDYCIDQARDWQHSVGDFKDDVPNDNNRVFVDEV